jgi:integrase
MVCTIKTEKKMPKIKFTDTNLTRLKHEGKVEDHYDTKSSGLLLRVGKKTKTFYIYLKRSMHKLGNFCPHDINGLNVQSARIAASMFRAGRADYTSGFDKVTLEYYIDNHYATDVYSLKTKKVSDNHIKTFKRYFSHALSKCCSKITDEDFCVFLVKFKHLKENTIRKAYYSLSAVLNVLVRKKRIKSNPLEKRSLSADSERPINTFKINRKELIAYILSDNFGKNTKYSRGFSIESRLITALVIDGGYRPGEILKNTSENYLLHEDPKVLIHAGLSKNNRPRQVPIFSDLLVKELKQYVKNKTINKATDYMFLNRSTNKHYTQGSYRMVWEFIKKKFMLSGRFYDFRHTFASDVYKHTEDIKLVADLIGDSIETASKYYVTTRVSSVRDLLSQKL